MPDLAAAVDSAAAQLAHDPFIMGRDLLSIHPSGEHDAAIVPQEDIAFEHDRMLVQIAAGRLGSPLPKISGQADLSGGQRSHGSPNPTRGAGQIQQNLGCRG